LRSAQSKSPQEEENKFDPLIDQLESVSKELQNALWAMELASEDLLDEDNIEI
jgi:hypothetical protein